ncbi:hypothetical protein [Bacteroides sp.]|uniref:outer membrane beta-barrel protein n=1 Tax=Bacteroides sp. TaxID=29523 RepID=UPI002601D8DA|nr:hypothetical protein [Bacteroides sp.]MDD3037580.1 hypothetical protein [Bacteroides sp.]
MKHLLLLLLLIAPMSIIAQQKNNPQDTTLYLNGRKIVVKEQGDKIKVKLYEKSSGKDSLMSNIQIFEGVYLNGKSMENRTILDALPFTKRKKRNINNFAPHLSGLYFGYMMVSENFGTYNQSDQISINATHSWEIGGTLFTSSHSFGPTQNWGFAIGLGWGYRSMRLDGNYAFRDIDGVTQIVPGESGEIPMEYSKSRLRYFYFRIPLSIEWQTRLCHRKAIFFSAGPEAEIRHGFKSKGKINGKKQTFDKNLHGRPVGINLLVQAGYGNLGFYTRYATYGLFEKGKGPEILPFSFGLSWYW